MSLYAQPTTKDSVRAYLLAGYEVTEAEVDQFLNSNLGSQAVRGGVSFRSNAGYVADQIAEVVPDLVEVRWRSPA